MDSLISAIFDKFKYKKIALAYPVDDKARLFSHMFKSKLAQKGIRPIFEFSFYTNPIPDFKDLVSEVEHYKPEVVYFIDDIEMASRFATALGSELRSRVRLAGSAEWSDINSLRRSRNAMQRAIFVSPFVLGDSELPKKFNESYKNIYGRSPDFLSAQGYDSGVLFLNAYENLLGDKISFSQALNNIKQYQGLTGVISVKPNGELNRRLKVVEYINDSIVEINSSSKVYRSYK